MMVGMPVPFTAAVTDATGGNVKIQRKDLNPWRQPEKST